MLSQKNRRSSNIVPISSAGKTVAFRQDMFSLVWLFYSFPALPGSLDKWVPSEQWWKISGEKSKAGRLQRLWSAYLSSLFLAQCLYDAASQNWSPTSWIKFFFNIGTGCHSSWCIREKCLLLITTTSCSGRQFLLNRKPSRELSFWRIQRSQGSPRQR